MRIRERRGLMGLGLGAGLCWGFLPGLLLLLLLLLGSNLRFLGAEEEVVASWEKVCGRLVLILSKW